VRQRTVVIGNLAGGDAGSDVEDVADIPQHRYMRVLPENESCRCGEECKGGQPVTKRPAANFVSI
jgi:hypothetical protein